MEKKQFDKKHFRHIYYAHRGLHDIKKGIPENSLAAFRAAAKAGYGAELDVRLSKDGQVVVFHDDTLSRACGMEGTAADYNYQDLCKMTLFGTDESIPLFSDALNVFQKGGGPLIVELKTIRHNTELCRKTYEILKTYPGVYCIESFNPFIVRWFKKNAPEVFRGQLSQSPGRYPKYIPRIIVHVLSSCRLSFLNKPDFIAYEICKRPKRILDLQKKGILLFAWTSRTPGRDEADNDAIIFENYLPERTY